MDKSKVLNWVAGGVTAVMLVAVAGGITMTGINAANAARQHVALMAAVKVDGRVMNAAAQDDSELQDAVTLKSAVQANQAQAAADTAARVAAEQAAAAAAAAAAQAAAEQAAQEQAQQQAQSDESDAPSTGGDTGSSSPDPVKCPAGTVAQAVDENGNESNCLPTNGNGQPCVAYDDNNNCTAWLDQ